MTAAEAAAQIAKLAAAGPTAHGAGAGVFSLDQLKGLGKTGTMSDQWTAQGAPIAGALISGGGNAAITTPGLKAGYYQIPGQSGAEYYDPSKGQASAEFVKYANALTPDQFDPFSGDLLKGFIPPEGGPEASVAANQPSARALSNFNAIIASGKGNDGTYQDSQDRVLGIGKYQQFVIGKDGNKIRISDAIGSAADPTYRDVSTFRQPPTAGGMRTDVPSSDLWKLAIPAAAAKDQHNADAYAGLQQERIAAAATAAGVDVGSALKYGSGLGSDQDLQNIANTGVSSAQKKQIYDTYGRIGDPSEKAAYIKYQDPGNLTAGLRKARIDAQAGDRNWMLKNQLAPIANYQMAGSFDKNQGGQIKTTIGDVTQTDKTTGRDIVFGNVPVKMEYSASGRGHLGSFDAAAHRLGGALYGGVMGYIGSFGNPYMAALGAFQGSGASGHLSIKNIGSGKMTWGQSQQAGDIKDVALTLGEAMIASRASGSMGVFGRTTIGAGMGTVNGFLSGGGAKEAIKGAIVGGIGGYSRGPSSQSWADKQYGPSFNSMGTAVR